MYYSQNKLGQESKNGGSETEKVLLAPYQLCERWTGHLWPDRYMATEEMGSKKHQSVLGGNKATRKNMSQVVRCSYCCVRYRHNEKVGAF